MVYWIVKGIGVNSERKAMLAVMISSIIICGLLGTLAGGNAIIAPVVIPLVAAVGLTPTTVTSLLRVGGEVGLMVGPPYWSYSCYHGSYRTFLWPVNVVGSYPF